MSEIGEGEEEKGVEANNTEIQDSGIVDEGDKGENDQPSGDKDEGDAVEGRRSSWRDQRPAEIQVKGTQDLNEAPKEPMDDAEPMKDVEAEHTDDSEHEDVRPEENQVTSKPDDACQVILRICSIDPEKRTDKQIETLFAWTSNVPLFQTLDPQQSRALCRQMTLEKFGAREVVFKQGDEGDKFYIVVTGSVSVHVAESVEDGEITDFLYSGSGFGDLALQSNAPRSATITTTDRASMLVLSRSDYELFAGSQHRSNIEMQVEFLQHCAGIRDALWNNEISLQDIVVMANWMRELPHIDEAQSVISRQGDPADRLIFVRSGQVAMLRTVELTNWQKARAGSRCSSSASQNRSRVSSHWSNYGPDGESESDDDVRPSSAQSQISHADRVVRAMMTIKKQQRMQRLETLGSEKKKHVRRKGDVSGELQQISGAPDSNAAGSTTEPPEEKLTLKGVAQSALKTVQFLHAAEGIREKEEKPVTLDGERNVDHFITVSQMRAKLTALEAKKARENLTPEALKLKAERKAALAKAERKAAMRRTTTGGSMSSLGSIPRRSTIGQSLAGPKRILRVGTLGPYQYFGDRQIPAGEALPVSLVADPVAEVYEISKYDILRKIPKRLLAVLFKFGTEVQPGDADLVELHRQTQRWHDFRRCIHAQVLEKCRDQAEREQQPTAAAQRAMKNLEFLGISATDDAARSLLLPPRLMRKELLTAKDQEHFSDVNACFLRRHEAVRRDPSVHRAYKLAGITERHQQRLGLLGDDVVEEEEDPMAIIFEQKWSAVDTAKFGLNLEQALDMDSQQLSETSPPVEASSSAAASEAASSPRSPRASHPSPHGAPPAPVAAQGCAAGGSSGELQRTQLPSVVVRQPPQPLAGEVHSPPQFLLKTRRPKGQAKRTRATRDLKLPALPTSRNTNGAEPRAALQGWAGTSLRKGITQLEVH